VPMVSLDGLNLSILAGTFELLPIIHTEADPGGSAV
jgi:hypothetical protein